MYFAKHYNHTLTVVMIDHKIPYEMINKKKKYPHRKLKFFQVLFLLMEIVDIFTYRNSR